MQILPMPLLRKGPSSGPPTVSQELAWCSHGENCLETRLVSPAGAAQVASSPEVESVLSEADEPTVSRSVDGSSHTTKGFLLSSRV